MDVIIGQMLVGAVLFIIVQQGLLVYSLRMPILHSTVSIYRALQEKTKPEHKHCDVHGTTDYFISYIWIYLHYLPTSFNFKSP